MRVLSVVFALLFLAAVAVAQAPQPRASSRPPATPPSSQPVGTLAQVMRGINFPNSNLLFDVQTQDPGVPRKKSEGGAGATAAFANVYTGWEVVENAAVALGESANLIMIPGRLCSNGKPVPLQRADFRKYADGLRQVAKAALKVAQTKNQEKMSDITNDVAEACSNCHEVYRDKGPAGSPARCAP